MISNVQKNIIVRAVRIRLKNGELLDEILASYPNLSDIEKIEIASIIDIK